MTRPATQGSAAVGAVLVVGADHADRRLDVFLTAQLGGSRARVQRLIERGGVRVDGGRARADQKLRAGARVEVAAEPAAEQGAEPAAQGAEPAPDGEDDVGPQALAVEPEEIPLPVLFEDDAMLVVAKPAGMVAHPVGDISGGTLANAVAHRWGAAPALVHRLDRDTSGVVVVPRTALAWERLAAQFRERTVRKEYVALVYGRVSGARGRVDAPLRRDRKNRLRMVVCPQGEGRAALTLYAVRAAWPEVTLLDVEIKTGRTHQIRVHCAHLGHPVVADEMYGKGRLAHVRDGALRAAIEATGRQFLHAARLSLDHPVTGDRLTFEAPLGDDLRALLASLGPPVAAPGLAG